MPFTNQQKVGELVTLVVETARRGQDLTIPQPTELFVMEQCYKATQERLFNGERDVVVVAAGLVAGGLEMARRRHRLSITPDDVNRGYWSILRSGLERPDVDMECQGNIFKCTETTILAREHELKNTLEPFRALLDAIGEP